MFFENAHFANSEAGHLFRQTREIFRELHVRMRVGGSRKRNAFLDRQFDDPVSGVKFVYRLAPSSGRQLNRKIARSNEIERFANDGVDLCVWPMTMDFYEVEMSEAIDKPSRGNFTDTPKIICVNGIDISAIELLGAGWDAVEHLIRAIEEMDRAQDKIELIPMLLDPFSPSRRVNRVIIQLDPGADSQVEVSFPQTIDRIKTDSGVITIVIGEGDLT